MKFSPTTQKPFKWLFAFLLACFLIPFNGLQAQTYVSSSVAKDRLTTKANQLDAQFAQGTISQVDYTISIKFVRYVLEDGITNHEFNSSAANTDKITGLYQGALQTAETAILNAFPQNAIEITSIKEELDTLLQQ